MLYASASASVSLVTYSLPIILLLVLIVGTIGIVLVISKSIRYFVNIKKQLTEINQKMDKITRD